MESGSTFYNNIGMLSLFVLVWVLHLISFLLYLWAKDGRNWVKRLIIKIFNFFMLNAYIRFFIEVYTFILLASMFEVKYYIKSSKGSWISAIVSGLLILISILFILVAVWSWIKTRNTTLLDSKWLTRELYSGIKDWNHFQPTRTIRYNQNTTYSQPGVSNKVKIARIFILAFLLRRLILITIIVLMDEFDYGLAISSMITLQIGYLVLIIYIRSLKTVKDQIWEVVNEILFFLHVLSLAYLIKKERWTKTFESISMALILFNTIFLWFMMLVSLIFSWAQKMRRRKKEKDNNVTNLTLNRSNNDTQFARRINSNFSNLSSMAPIRNNQKATRINKNRRSK